MKTIICHYGEIALKGKNRPFFEKKLIENIKIAIGNNFLVKRIGGRITIKNKNGFGEEILREALPRLKKIPGIIYFFLAEESLPKIKDIGEISLKIIEKNLKEKNKLSFKIETKRSDKSFSLTSQELNEKIGGFILEKIKNNRLSVKMKEADTVIGIEITKNSTFIYEKKGKINGVGGLPVGVSGKAISLISGGIDSPVASFLAMKRGLEISFVHFHSYPITDKSSIEKTKKIVSILSAFQPKTTFYLAPIAKWQKKIFTEGAEKLRVLLLRRMMVRVAEEIAKREKAKAIITGENLGQVASQTVENIKAISSASNGLILRPLISYDKTEIIKIAEKIGTYKISILPYEDSCSKFLPKFPETKADLELLENEEKKLNFEKYYKEIIKNTEKENKNSILPDIS